MHRFALYCVCCGYIPSQFYPCYPGLPPSVYIYLSLYIYKQMDHIYLLRYEKVTTTRSSSRRDIWSMSGCGVKHIQWLIIIDSKGKTWGKTKLLDLYTNDAFSINESCQYKHLSHQNRKPNYRDKTVFTSIDILIINIRRSWDRK